MMRKVVTSHGSSSMQSPEGDTFSTCPQVCTRYQDQRETLLHHLIPYRLTGLCIPAKTCSLPVTCGWTDSTLRMTSSRGLECSTSIDNVLQWLVTAFSYVPHQITHTFLKDYSSKIVPKQPQKDPQSTWEKDAEARWLRKAGSWSRTSPEGNRESLLSLSHPCRYEPPRCWISSRFYSSKANTYENILLIEFLVQIIPRLSAIWFHKYCCWLWCSMSVSVPLVKAWEQIGWTRKHIEMYQLWPTSLQWDRKGAHVYFQ